MSLVLVLALAAGLAGCSGETTPVTPSPLPAGPPAVPTPNPSLLTVTDPSTGFITTDLYDAEDRIVQFTRNGELIWAGDGRRLPGYSLKYNAWASAFYVVGNGLECHPERCFSLVVRFGSEGGQRRAYLTAEYDVDDLIEFGTIVSLTPVGDIIRATWTDRLPPGTPTLSGQVTEMTEFGPRPVTRAEITYDIWPGYRSAITDSNGFYQIHGLIDGTADVVVNQPAFQWQRRPLTINGDTSVDFQLVRR